MNGKNDGGNLCGQKISAEYAQVLATFPEELQKLVAEEVKDGNAIQSIEHGFPAAPCGASLKLARQAKAERRVSTTGVDFYARNNAQYSGEFTTHQRHFFVLEPHFLVSRYPIWIRFEKRWPQGSAWQTQIDFERRFNSPRIAPLALTSSIDFERV